jgi:hypothetical protein
MRMIAKTALMTYKKLHLIYHSWKRLFNIVTWSIANVIAMAAAQIDLSSKYQVNSSTHPLENA